MYNKFVTNITATSTNSTINLLNEMDMIALKHLMLNNEAMNQTHFLGYNGFKRMHRVLSKSFYDWHIQINCDAIDKYRTKISGEVDNINYNPETIKEHLMGWEKYIVKDIENLGKLLNCYRDLTGITYKVGEEMLQCLVKKYEKTGRWYKRFEETLWSAHDMHYVDDYLHCKYKKIEEGE